MHLKWAVFFYLLLQNAEGENISKTLFRKVHLSLSLLVFIGRFNNIFKKKLIQSQIITCESELLD
jgi:hypothetical protein